MPRDIPKGANKMKDFGNKAQAEAFKAHQIEAGYKAKMTTYHKYGLKEPRNKRHAVYYWKPK